MDELDEKILEKLEIDARTPFLQIAKDLQVSEGTIRKRVSQLKQSRIIKQFTIKRDKEATAIVGIVTNPHIQTSEIVKQLKFLKTKVVYEVTGRYDIICTVTAQSLEEANDILENIRTTPGVQQTETFTILKEN